MSLVELCADPEEHQPAPCRFGNIITGHACYCHHKSPEAPRKCPIWRAGNPEGWMRGPWEEGCCPLFEPCKPEENKL